METCLQIADHWITIISGIFAVLLTLVTTWLAWKTFILTKSDKQKSIAINELKSQTNELKRIYLLQIQPKFGTVPSSTDYMKIINIGGDCYDLTIKSTVGTYGKHGNPFKAWDNHYSSQTQKSINYSIYGDRDFIFSFEDKFGNKMEQTLFTSKRKFSNLRHL